MEIDIRKYIVNNFKNTTIEEIKESIEEALKKEDDITLPGLGVLFELLWKNNNDEGKNKIANTLFASLK